jgi:hypothetical protein
MADYNLLDRALDSSPSAVAYRISRALAEMNPGKHVLETDDPSFDPWRFAHGGECEISRSKSAHTQIETEWHGPGKGATESPGNSWLDVVWKGKRCQVVQASFWAGYNHITRRWLVADDAEVARRMFLEVCEFCHALRKEIMVFNGGCWSRSHELYEAVRASSFDDLFLAGALKQDIKEDLTQFLSARAEYERYGVPWKRGVLFVGPPGNGKTHCLRATIKLLDVPCLYVQSVKSKYETEDANLGRVFKEARRMTPCCLVLEDLDAMITPKNRSFFLNQIDGFEKNAGILTLATTNHPERLDPAILDRPSRFDRKYHFGLPALEERVAYVAHWNGRLDAQMRVDEAELARLAEHTAGFSYAYVKELFVSSMVRWMATKAEGAMKRILGEQLELLRAQMTSEPAAEATAPIEKGGEEHE